MIKGFRPDDNVFTPDIILSGSNFIPSTTGISMSRVGVALDVEPISNVTGSKIVKLLDINRHFTATSDGVYELVGSEYIERATWTSEHSSITSLGNISLVANYTDKIKAAALASDFVPISEAPKAKIILECSGMVLAFNYVDTEIVKDGWWSSSIYDHTKWIPADSNTASYGRLMDSTGEIVAAEVFNDKVCAYKEDSMYVGEYQGSELKWTWRVQDNLIGCVGKSAVCNTPYGQVFVNHRDILLYDGNQVKSIGDGIKYWFSNNLSQADKGRTTVTWDSVNGYLFIGFVSTSSGWNTLVLKMDDMRWGLITKFLPTGVEPVYVFDYVSGYVPIDDFVDEIDSYYDAIDSPKYVGGSKFVGIYGSDGLLYTLTGSSAGGTIKFSIQGNIQQYTNITAVTPVFTVANIGSCNLYGSDSSGSNMSLLGSSSLFMNKFNFIKRSKHYQAELVFDGYCDLLELGYIGNEGGVR